MFIDEATVRVRGGRGGNGVIHFRSSRANLRGGPDGGNGGPGGSVIFRASPSLSTLFSFRSRPTFRAENGADGARNDRHGGRGADEIVFVPVGTVIRDTETGEVLADLAAAGEEVVVARGGAGGRGNASFVTPTRRAPRICERGLSGERRTLRLELKLIADVGIIGYPNVGKSSLISRVSKKRAKIADYPFTTITPNLGVVELDAHRHFVAVDLPGLIDGAHEGKGLGDRFLRHVERTRVFIHVVDLAPAEVRDPIDDYRRINRELEAFSPGLAARPQVVAGNKIDVAAEDAVRTAVARFAEIGVELLPISAATGAGVGELIARTDRVLQGAREREEVGPSPVRRRVYRYRGETGFRVERTDDGFVVKGEAVERLAKQLVLDSDDAVAYLNDRLEKMGVLKELRRQGFAPGETVRIGEVELEVGG